ncbi:MAG: hypothetical protein QRY71_02445 [Candidatus Rhabdochlamydia sp.]
MTIRLRSSSCEHPSYPEIITGQNTLESSVDSSLAQASLKKMRCVLTEALHIGESKSLQRESQLKDPLKKDRDYTLMNNPDILLRKIRHIITERWIRAIYHEPDNGVLLFNYGRMYPLLIEDHAKGRGLNGRKSIRELLSDIDLFHGYVCMNQEELFHEAAKRDFQGRCIYQRLALEYQFIDYTTLRKDRKRDDGPVYWMKGTLSTSAARKNFLKLIDLYPNNDRYYGLLGKLMRYRSILSCERDPSQGEDEDEFLLPQNIKTEKDLYLKALELNPLNDEAYVGLGLLHQEKSTEDDRKKAQELYLKALHLNPHNLEAAILLSKGLTTVNLLNHHRGEMGAVTFLDGSRVEMRTVIENAFDHAPYYLAIIPHWREIINLFSIELEKNPLSILLKKFTSSSLIEKHIKRNTLKFLINSCDGSGAENECMIIANLLFFLSRPHLVDVDKDLKLMQYYSKLTRFNDDYDYYYHSIIADFYKAYFPHDQNYKKNIVNDLIRLADREYIISYVGLYHLATLISPHENIQFRLRLLGQQQLYLEAALKEYDFSDKSYTPYRTQYACDLGAKILGSYALTLEANQKGIRLDGYDSDEDEGEEDVESVEETKYQYNYKSFDYENALRFNKKNIYLKALKIGYASPWPYFYLGKEFEKPLAIEGKEFHSPQELFLTALDLDEYHAESYQQLGDRLSSEESITLLNGTTLSCQQLYRRAIQLGIQEADVYFQAAKMMKKNQAILLFDGFTYLSKIDLLFKAFSMDVTSSYYLHQIALYFKYHTSEKCIA